MPRLSPVAVRRPYHIEGMPFQKIRHESFPLDWYQESDPNVTNHGVWRYSPSPLVLQNTAASLQQPVEGRSLFKMLAYSGAWTLLIEDPRSVYFAANLTYPFAPDGQRTILLLCSLRASCTELRALVRLCLRELLILLGLLHRDAPLPAPREALRLVQVPSPGLE